MKFLNNFINKVGYDKLLHFLTLALIAAYAAILGPEYMWGAMILSPIIGCFKELFDSKFDLKDVLAGIIGSVFSATIYWILQLLLLI